MKKRESLIITLVAYSITMAIGLITFFTLKDQVSLLINTLIIDVVMTVIIFLFSIRYNNSSMYDPYWSVIPVFIVIIWMLNINGVSEYSLVVLFGVLIWSLRLTVNWFLNFKGFIIEDFRYVDFRNQFKSMYWIISFLGIHMFPTLIVLLGLYPIYFILTNEIVTIWFIYIGTVIMIIGAIISYISDNQLRSHKEENGNVSIMTGLWKYSRHPNYFGEVTFWAGIFITSLSIGFDINASLGFIAMLLLFNLYSVPKMEKKLLANKPDYHEVMKSVPRFFLRKGKNIGSEQNQKGSI